jgi:hypothetical protein
MALENDLIYINELPSFISKTQIHLFEDNTVVYIAISSSSDSLSLQEDLNKMQIWERVCKMKFNPSKCLVP